MAALFPEASGLDDIEVAYTAHDSIEADMILSNLRAEGIECGARVSRPWWDALLRPGPGHLFGDGMGSGPWTERGRPYAEILVHRGNLDRARTVIKALLEGQMEGFPEG